MTPSGRLRKAVKLLDQVDGWNDRTDRVPTYVLSALYQAQGLVAVTIPNVASQVKYREALERIANSGPLGGAWCVAVALQALEEPPSADAVDPSADNSGKTSTRV